jgi:hypothetical protein
MLTQSKWLAVMLQLLHAVRMLPQNKCLAAILRLHNVLQLGLLIRFMLIIIMFFSSLFSLSSCLIYLNKYTHPFSIPCHYVPLFIPFILLFRISHLSPFLVYFCSSYSFLFASYCESFVNFLFATIWLTQEIVKRGEKNVI